VKTTRGARRLRQEFIDAMVAGGASVASQAVAKGAD
jgi:hypothetical protein